MRCGICGKGTWFASIVPHPWQCFIPYRRNCGNGWLWGVPTLFHPGCCHRASSLWWLRTAGGCVLRWFWRAHRHFLCCLGIRPGRFHPFLCIYRFNLVNKWTQDFFLTSKFPFLYGFDTFYRREAHLRASLFDISCVQTSIRQLQPVHRGTIIICFCLYGLVLDDFSLFFLYISIIVVFFRSFTLLVVHIYEVNR